MSSFLLPSTPIYGHLSPMLSIGGGLVARGHTVTVLTGRKYRSEVESRGLTFLPLPPEADYDDADLDEWLPGRDQNGRLAAGRYDILGLFVSPLAAQHRAFAAALAAHRYDAVLSETVFLGVLPTLLTVPATERIPMVGISATPMSLTSVDCAPFGSGFEPRGSLHDKFRIRVLHQVLHRGPLKPVHDALDDALRPYGVPPGSANFFDQAAKFDTTFHLAPPGMEYPRREMPATIRFVGPLRPEPGAEVALPPWWDDLDGSRPVVHVTQGTLDNLDPGRLLAPAIRALADEEVLVVASTGGRPVRPLLDRLGGRLPTNARVAEFLPYDALLPRTAVMVTNGGFGGVQRALLHGVPLVVAGESEDKPEVAARVAWSGSGLNLRTGSPAPVRIRAAVGRVLHDRRFAGAATRLRDEILTLGDPLTSIAAALEVSTDASCPVR